MTNDQLRKALAECNGHRDVEFVFTGSTTPCTVRHAMLVPDEDDHLIKLTDGKHVVILNAARVAWIKIG